MKKIITPILLLFLSLATIAQVPVATYEMKTDNVRQIDETTITWELWIRKASGEDFGLYTWQLQWQFNTGALNGGAFQTPFVTVAPGADGGIFMGHYNNADAVVGTGGSFFSYTPSQFPNVGEIMTLVSTDWKHIATWTAQLRKDGNPHNFGAADIAFAHRISGVVQVFASTVPHQTGNNAQITGTLYTPQGVSINDREMASHWFSGSGNWTDAARWNNVTTENANTVPGASNNAGISGEATVGSPQSIEELTVGSATVNLPTVTTGTISFFQPGVFFSTNNDNNVTSDGGSPVTARGIVVADTDDPNFSSSGVVNYAAGSGTGTYSAGGPTGSIQNSWYYRAYATNANGTAYGDARLISNNATIGAPATGGAVQVNGSLVISESGSLTASQLFNDADESAITLLSSASGTGSLIHNNTGVQATMQRYMPGAVSAWHGISAPVSGMDILTSEWYPGADEDLFLWSEAGPGWWVNVKNQDGSGGSPDFPTANGGNDFAMGRGYIVNYNSANPTKSFAGQLNAGELQVPLLYNSSKLWEWEAGWNLVGNPYASGLNFNTINKSGLAEDYAQVYDPNKDGGEGYVTATTIAAGQAFFVKAANSAAFLGLQTTDQLHGGTFYKNQTAANDKLVLRLSNDTYYDETQLLLKAGSQAGYDYYDASKIYSWSNEIPQLSSRVDQRPLLINSIPQLSPSTIIPLRLLIPANGEYALEAQTIEGAFELEGLFVSDLETGLIHDLKESAYTFTAQGGETDRLLIQFEVVGLSETENRNAKAWYANNHIHINGLTGTYTVQLTDLSGRFLFSREAELKLTDQFAVLLEPGVYLLVLNGEKQTQTLKVQVD